MSLRMDCPLYLKIVKNQDGELLDTLQLGVIGKHGIAAGRDSRRHMQGIRCTQVVTGAKISGRLSNRGSDRNQGIGIAVDKDVAIFSRKRLITGLQRLDHDLRQYVYSTEGDQRGRRNKTENPIHFADIRRILLEIIDQRSRIQIETLRGS